MAASNGGNGGFESMKAWPQRAKDFYNDVRTEMKKVTTPTVKEVRATTTVVVIAVFLFGVYFAVIDKVIETAIGRVISYFAHR